MQWQYRTLLIEFQKDGLLGDKYIDDEAAEDLLNKMGAHGWELVNVAMIQEGLLAFCKRPRDDNNENAPVFNEQQPALDTSLAGKQSLEKPESVSAALLQQEEREHIRNLEMKRRKKMSERNLDSVGGIKIS